MRRHTRLLIFLAAAIVLLATTGTIFYARAKAATAQTQTGQVQTTQVQQGDITLSASGTAQLDAPTTVQLGFRSSGTVASIDVQVGDKVKVGQALARLDDTTAQIALIGAEIGLKQLTSAQAVAAAEQALANAQNTLKTAQYTQYVQQKGHRASDDTLRAAQAKLTLAQDQVDQAKTAYDRTGGSAGEDPAKAAALVKLAAAQTSRDTALRNLNWLKGSPSTIDQALLDSAVKLAEANVSSAQGYLDELTGKSSVTEIPDNPGSDLIKLRQAKLAVDTAKDNLVATQLLAPFDGTITAVSGVVGTASGNASITVTDLAHPVIDITLDQSDLGMAAVGNAIQVTLDSYPDLVFTGKITRVDPMLVTVENIQTVHAIGQLDDASLQKVLSLPVGLSGSVEVISASVQNALLVPIEALHDLSAGQYGVFVMKNGQPTLQVVQVGLQNAVYAEIKSGVSLGDVVTTGVVKK